MPRNFLASAARPAVMSISAAALLLMAAGPAPAQPKPPAPKSTAKPAADRYATLIETVRQDLQAGQFTQALVNAQQAARANPSDYKAPYYIAYALMSLGDFEGAAEAQQRSLGMAGEQAQAIVTELGQSIKARREVGEADVALADGLFAKAARLYMAAWDAGVQQGEVGLKAAQLLEQRLGDAGTAARLYREVATRVPGTPAAEKAALELQRLRPLLAGQGKAKLLAALRQPPGQRSAALEAALAADPDSRELLVLLANEAARARDWNALQARLKRLSQRGWAEDALRMRHVDLSGWEGDLRLRSLLEDTWGPERARQMLLLLRGFRDCAEAYCPDLVGIPAGAFVMGSPAGEAGHKPAEGPQRPVAVPGFAISRTEVTQKQWRTLMGSNPSAFPACSGNGDDCPVEQVSWADAQAFVRKLSETTGKTYRLPSEAEWEYAARAGTTTPFASGDSISALQANFDDSKSLYEGQPGKKLERTTAVAGYGANGFGLFDMAGNVWEWTEDCWHANYDGAPQDGSAWTSGGDCSSRVARGGGWHNSGSGMRSAQRSETKSGEKLRAVGLRVVRVPQP